MFRVEMGVGLIRDIENEELGGDGIRRGHKVAGTGKQNRKQILVAKF